MTCTHGQWHPQTTSCCAHLCCGGQWSLLLIVLGSSVKRQGHARFYVEHTVMDQVHILMATALSDGSGLAIMSMLLRNDLRNALMTQGVDWASKFTQIPIRSITCGIFWDKLDPWRLPHGIQDPQDPQQTSSFQTLQDTPWSLMTMFWKVGAVFAAQRGNRTILSQCVLCCGWSVYIQVYFYKLLLF